MGGGAVCGVCGIYEEDVHHALFGCINAITVWNASEFLQPWELVQNVPVEEWISRLYHKVEREKLGTFVLLMWSI